MKKSTHLLKNLLLLGLLDGRGRGNLLRRGHLLRHGNELWDLKKKRQLHSWMPGNKFNDLSS